MQSNQQKRGYYTKSNCLSCWVQSSMIFHAACARMRCIMQKEAEWYLAKLTRSAGASMRNEEDQCLIQRRRFVEFGDASSSWQQLSVTADADLVIHSQQEAVMMRQPKSARDTSCCPMLPTKERLISYHANATGRI
jgi:hypothetical protein